MVVLIIGPPGSGKGTQSKLIADKLELVHISTGDVLRKAVEDKSELGLKVKDLMDKGQLVPDDVMIECIKDILSKRSSKNGLILDGFPRTVQQAVALDKILKDFGYTDIRILTMNVDEEELIKRLHIFHEQTEPVLKYYDGKAKIFNTNGVGSIEEINEDILKKLNTH